MYAIESILRKQDDLKYSKVVNKLEWIQKTLRVMGTISMLAVDYTLTNQDAHYSE